MITSRQIIGSHHRAGILAVASFLFAGLLLPSTNLLAEEAYANQRVELKQIRRASTRQSRSLVAQAATGRLPAEAPEAPLDGSLVNNNVRRTGFLDTYGSNCGPVCDCGGCGVEEVVCGVDEVVCGVEEAVCGIEEAACGIDGVYQEHGCGVEVGCGIGAAIDRLGPVVAPLAGSNCGVVGCTDCYENACGIEGVYAADPVCGLEVHGDCSCDACNDELGNVPLCLPLLRINWKRFDFFVGVQGFKGPLNFANTNAANANIRSGSGSFGFYQGYNEGRSLRRWLGWDMAMQTGVRATQSNLSGAEFTNETRHQVFVTAGLFRQVDYGLQYGLVVDYLNQDWYFQGDSVQLRGELSWRNATCHIWGFQFMAGLEDDNSTTFVDDGAGNQITSTITFEPTDQYRVFYRRLLNQSGHWNAFAGWTDNDDGLLGMDMSLPMRRNLLLSTGVTYLIPHEGSGNNGNEEEGWNISLGLVYRPGGPKGGGRYCRPMFDVADNGTFMLDRL